MVDCKKKKKKKIKSYVRVKKFWNKDFWTLRYPRTIMIPSEIRITLTPAELLSAISPGLLPCLAGHLDAGPAILDPSDFLILSFFFLLALAPPSQSQHLLKREQRRLSILFFFPRVARLAHCWYQEVKKVRARACCCCKRTQSVSRRGLSGF